MKIYNFMRYLNKNKNRLTIQQFKTIKGQALAGDIIGANKGLDKLLKRSR